MRPPSTRTRAGSAYRHPLAALALLLLGIVGTSADSQIGTIAASDLNGREIVFPRDLPGQRTLALIAYERGQQGAVDSWVEGLDLRQSDIPWVELPVIEDRGALFRSFIDNGMRSGIVQPEARARVVTLYTDPEAFRRRLGLEGAQTIHAVVLSREGRVLARAAGPYSEEKARVLLRALQRG